MSLSILPRRPIVVIPARLASTRLPNKPLAEIHGQPMIVQVWRRATEADIGQAVLTDPAHPSGSDRIFEAVERRDPDRLFDAVVNLQGDLPALDPKVIRAAFAPLADAEVQIATLAAVIVEPREVDDPNVVKAVLSVQPGASQGRALYFSRRPVPANAGPLWHHIGLYAYRRAALDRFVSLPPSPLEQREKLEQLRALEAGMRIDAMVVDTVPLGVDTPHDLERARDILAGRR